jgi:hypothetical protein
MGRTALALTITSEPEVGRQTSIKAKCRFLSACLSVLETELDTAEIVTDEDFATVSRLDCIIGYHFSLHGYGQMQNRQIRIVRLPDTINIPAREKLCG